jgi:hypothetical protein
LQRTKQQPKNQSRRTELRHEAFCGILGAVRPLSPAEGGAFILGFGLGIAQPGAARAAALIS